MPHNRTISRARSFPRPIKAGSPKVFVVLGQSNVVGTSELDGSPANNTTWDSEIGLFDSSGTIGTVSSLSNGWKTFASHFTGYGPERGFARAFAANGMEDVHVIKFARNGTSLASHWCKNLNVLYPEMLAFIEAGLGVLQRTSFPKLSCIFWFQGHSDTMGEANANAYGANLTQFISDIRADLKSPTVPFIIGRSPAWWTTPYRDVVRAAQVSVAESVGNGWVNSDDTTYRDDFTHLTSGGKELVGIRMAELYLEL